MHLCQDHSCSGASALATPTCRCIHLAAWLQRQQQGERPCSDSTVLSINERPRGHSWYSKVNSAPQWTVLGFLCRELCRADVVFVSLFTGDRPAGLLDFYWNVVERLWSEAIPTTVHPLSPHYAESQPRLGGHGQWGCLREEQCVSLHGCVWVCSCSCHILNTRILNSSKVWTLFEKVGHSGWSS